LPNTSALRLAAVAIAVHSGIPLAVHPFSSPLPLLRLPTHARNGYWGTVAYVPFALLINAALIGTPYIVTRPIGIPNPIHMRQHDFETAGRLITCSCQYCSILTLLRRPVRQWVTQREDAI
jgi:hypothetical protein